MTGKEIETVAVLLKRVRERADEAKRAVTQHFGPGVSMVSPGYIEDLSEGMKSLAAAIEMVATELASVEERAALSQANFLRRLDEREKARRSR